MLEVKKGSKSVSIHERPSCNDLKIDLSRLDKVKQKKDEKKSKSKVYLVKKDAALAKQTTSSGRDPPNTKIV